LTAALDDNFGEPFQRNKCFRMQVVRVVDEQGDRLLGAPEQFLKLTFTPLALAGDRHRLVRRQVVEQGRDQQWHRDLSAISARLETGWRITLHAKQSARPRWLMTVSLKAV
jgi:hypothetical protein